MARDADKKKAYDREYSRRRRENRRALPTFPPPPVPPKAESPAELAVAEVKQRRAETELASVRSRLRHTQDMLAEAQGRLDVVMGYKADLEEMEPIVIGAAPDRERERPTEATVVLVLSDWHVGERVTYAQTNGLNEYNPDIAEQRARRCYQNAVKLIRHVGSAVPVKHVVVGLLGDFITGNIHDELKETNAFSPADETKFATQLHVGGIRYLLNELPDYIDFDFVCKSGNHGRITQKKQIATAEGNSLEAVMYASMAALFEDSRCRWHLSPSYHAYLDIHGVVHRFHHGDEIMYNGGVGGLTIPLNKAIRAWNDDLPAHFDVLGHFHTRTIQRNALVNSSLIGTTPYGRFRVKASSETPTQSLYVVDSHRGITGHWPVWVMD